MKLRLFAVKAVAVSGAVLLLAGASLAGDIKGKVSVQGMKSAENIAVYVDAIPDKKFDRSGNEAGDRSDQDDVCATRDGCASGNHRGIPEQRSGGPQRILAEHQREQEARAQPGHLAEGREERPSSSTMSALPACSATSIQK